MVSSISMTQSAVQAPLPQAGSWLWHLLYRACHAWLRGHVGGVGGTLIELPPLSLADSPFCSSELQDPHPSHLSKCSPINTNGTLLPPHFFKCTLHISWQSAKAFFLTHLLILRIGSLQHRQHKHDTLKAKSRSTWVPVSKENKRQEKPCNQLASCQCLLEQEHYPHHAEGTCHQGQPALVDLFWL